VSDSGDVFRPIDRSQHELLIVDDDPTSRYVTARLLRSAGFRIREAATGAEGLERADAGISAVILDVHLPDLDGFELCRLWRSRPATVRLPVLHLSAAYVTDDDKVRGLDSGADAYLTHPVEPAVLVATVQALVRAHVAEEAMRHSEAKFRAIYTEAPGGICLLDAGGRFVDANPVMLAFLQCPLDLIIGRMMREFVPPDWAERAQAFASRLHANETRAEFPLVGAAGQRVALEWSIASLVEPGISMALATDISQRVALEQQRRETLDREKLARSTAEHLNHMKDEFIAVLSHELRSPLNAISAWTYVLQKRSADPEAQRGLAAIERNTKVQARLISDLLDMSRINLGKLELAFEPVDVREAVEMAAATLRHALDENGNPFDIAAPDDLPLVEADAGRLQQIVWNLLSNAIKFSPRGAPIRIALAVEGSGVRVSVADSGQGIAPEFAPYLFDKFAQADTASNRKRGGLGLGLSIVRHLVESHGGTIVARSEGLGQGATFDVWLPLHPADAKTTPPAARRLAPDTDALAGLNLLLVDDDAEACALIGGILAELGAGVRVAASVDAALAQLEADPPDVMISDIGMPGRDGLALIREVRRSEAAGSRLPAIALTSFARTEDREQAFAAGFDLHCPKPVHPPLLVEQIRELAGPRGGASGG
jgi:PAS domain S-box-containing protein